MKRQLILETGDVFTGVGFGSREDVNGEVVFNTGMTGYQEMLTDPSYCKQLLTLTYPLVGNYGMNRDDIETLQPSIGALIVKEAAQFPSNWRSEGTIDEWLKEKGIPGLAGIDTRKLTRMLREHGTLMGKICDATSSEEKEKVVNDLKDRAFPSGQVDEVSTKDPYHAPGRGYRVVLIDFGAKHGIVRNLIERGFDVYVVPYDMPAEKIMQLKPDGVMLSNGPGNPEDVPEGLETVKELLGQVPIFGICLGHQLLCLACGATSSKMKFGHRGGNHPVKDLQTGRVDITSQNHGYTINRQSLEGTGLSLTHINVNDDSVEGVEHETLHAFSVQYHPEANPGPSDPNHLFDRFVEYIKSFKEKQLVQS